jgi:predicted lipoprotein with Yx(FWY)xxD motif
MSEPHVANANAHHKRTGKVAGRALAVSVVGVLGVVGVMGLAGAAAPQLIKANVKSYSAVLENSAHHTYYLLTTEKGGKVHCKGTCATNWLPLLVKSSVKSVAWGFGVHGAIGFVKRTSTKKQVTYNGYPIYTFIEDGADRTTGIVGDGGTWYLVSAAARNAKATLVTHATTSTSPTTTMTKPTTTATPTTTTTPPATTTTIAVGGSGF